jgi:hypothetical protein
MLLMLKELKSLEPNNIGDIPIYVPQYFLLIITFPCILSVRDNPPIVRSRVSDVRFPQVILSLSLSVGVLPSPFEVFFNSRLKCLS